MAEINIEIKTEMQGNRLMLYFQYTQQMQILFDFVLEVKVYEENLGTNTDVKVYQRKFYSKIQNLEIRDLKFSSMFRVSVGYHWGQSGKRQEKVKNLFVWTQAERRQEQQQEESERQNERNPDQQNFSYNSRNISNRQPPRRNQSANLRSNSNNLNKHRNQDLCTSQHLVKTLAQSKRISDKNKIHQYLLQSRNCRNTKQFVNQKQGRLNNIQEVIDKRMLVAQSKILFSEVYKYRDGCKMMKNDWFMGPFYSYDQNQKQIRR